jgi:hypothetical protein
MLVEPARAAVAERALGSQDELLREGIALALGGRTPARPAA